MLLEVLDDPHEIRRICIMGRHCTLYRGSKEINCDVTIEKHIAEGKSHSHLYKQIYIWKDKNPEWYHHVNLNWGDKQAIMKTIDLLISHANSVLFREFSIWIFRRGRRSRNAFGQLSTKVPIYTYICAFTKKNTYERRCLNPKLVFDRCESCHGQAERLLDSAKEMEDSIAVNLRYPSQYDHLILYIEQ